MCSKPSEKKRKHEQYMQLFVETLKEYLKDRGEIVFSIAEEAGQKTLKIAARGLWRRYRPKPGEPAKFSEIIEELRKDEKLLQILENYGVTSIIDFEGEIYIIVDIDKAKTLLKR